ncbi:MAG: SMC-Scp complex subunit ScpB [Firmicutes bacterium]|nr:SMC-Scp complex subunit ScpB [Bacillota bacterium]
MRLAELESVIEAILFVTGEAVPLGTIADAVNMDKATTKAIINTLADKYLSEKRGMQIIEIDGAYQMCTAPECFEFIRNLYKTPQKQGLTQALLETLAIIAYKQPITKAQIEEVRGVNADHAVYKLTEKGLVQEVGRLDVPGRPILFGTTTEFLRFFGFKSTSELPPLDEGISLSDDELDGLMKDS